MSKAYGRLEVILKKINFIEEAMEKYMQKNKTGDF